MKTTQPENIRDNKDGISAGEASDVPSDTPAVLPTSDKSRRIHPLKIAVVILSFLLIILVGLLVHTSNKNRRNYYLKAYEGALEVWKGTFSPAGKKRMIIMPGMEPPDMIKAVYTQEEVYPLIFSYYLDKADALIHIMGMPDFVGIKTYLNRALKFATTDDHRKAVRLRLNRIDRAILYYKADVAASKGTLNGLEVAIEFLNQAASLEPDDIEVELIEKKKKNIRELMKAF